MSNRSKPASVFLYSSKELTRETSDRSTADRIAEIEKYMKEHRREYFKDESMQAEYRHLLEARERLDKRRAA